MTRSRVLSRFALPLALCLPLSMSAASKRGVMLHDQGGKVRVEIDGDHFTDYVYEGAPRPYLYPVYNHSGLGMTRNWPMKEVEGEEKDHKHHRGVWYGHRHVNGFSFWEETGKEGTIRQDGFDLIKSGREVGVIKSHHTWVSPKGEVECTDETTIRFYNRRSDRMLDFEITFHAPKDRDVIFGDDKDAAMAIRVAETMRLNQKEGKKTIPGKGHIVNSEGVRDGDTWGKRAAWCDYYGPVEGKTVGVAIFDHPSNPRHPTWWHVRDYGLFAANAFGKRHFEKLEDTHAGDMKLAAGASMTFRYRFYWHDGDEKKGRVAKRYDEYVKETKVASK